MSSDPRYHRNSNSGPVPSGVRFLLAAVICLLLGGTVAADPQAAHRFDGERAMELLVRQCEIGPRYPGSPGNLELRRQLAEAADQLGLRFQAVCFRAEDPAGSGEIEFCNLVVSAGPEGGSRLWLGAHYDTRPFSDMDPDTLRRDEPLLGANDGASGVAVLWHLMEIMGQVPPPRGVDLLFFDGEDSGTSGDLTSFCLGSQHLARTWQYFGSPLAGGQPEGLILLDMVGKQDLRIFMEGNSRQAAPLLTGKVFDRARDLGLDVLDPRPGAFIFDDHVPFLQVGIPAVNLIDLNYHQWHTTSDTPEFCSARSLGQVGALVVDLVYNP